MLTNLPLEGLEHLIEVEVLLDKMVGFSTLLNSMEDLFLDSHVAPVNEEFDDLVVLPVLHRVIRPPIQDLLRLLDLRKDLESFYFLLRLIVLLKSFEAFTQNFIIFLLAVESSELRLHCVHAKGVYGLLEDFVDEEVPTHGLQLLLVSLSNSILSEFNEHFPLCDLIGFGLQNVDLPVFRGHLVHLR